MTSKFSNKTLQAWYSFSGLPRCFYPKALETENFSEKFKAKVKSTLCPTIQESESQVFYYKPTALSVAINDTDRMRGFGYMCSRYIFDKGCCTYIFYRDLLTYLKSEELSGKDHDYIYADVVFIDGVRGLAYNEREADLFVSYMYRRFISKKKTVLCMLQDFPLDVQNSLGAVLNNAVCLWGL